MFTIKKSSHNPLISPDTNDPWEAKAVFNWCPVLDGKVTHYVYRAMSATEDYYGMNISISSIGYVKSKNGIDFTDRKQFIFPEYAWERYGCEDPRVTKMNGKFYIFYTALSQYPFNANGIKVAVAITKDFKTIETKHLVTPFNAKAMALFPEKVNGKYTAILSVNTDLPPAKICLAQFDTIEQMWDEGYWQDWYAHLDDHAIDPRRTSADHVEVGGVPVKTNEGWLLIYSHIENYFRDNNPFVKEFGVEALLLDAQNPRKIIGHTNGPMFAPLEIYEKFGQIPDIIFPSGALIRGPILEIYYGAADTVCCLASVKLANLLSGLRPNAMSSYITRYEKNPIITARAGFAWEEHGTFNPAALQIENTTHILYRAMADDDTSYIGYASSLDGYTIASRGDDPIYVPRGSFEKKIHPGNSGCEDPRLTLIGKTIYMCYTAYNGVDLPRIALTSIDLKDFFAKKWTWKEPILISPENVDDKDGCIFPEKIKGKYLVLHRVNHDVCADFVDSLENPSPLNTATPILLPRPGMWDSEKVGITAPPIKTKYGWLLLYHGISSNHHTYRVGVALLDLKDPTRVIARASQPIFQPEASYEKQGVIPNVVFPCGATVRGKKIFIYYGGADTVIGVATIELDVLLNSLL